MSDYTIADLYKVVKQAVEDGFGDCKISYFVHDSEYGIYGAHMSEAGDWDDIDEEYGSDNPIVYENHLSLSSW